MSLGAQSRGLIQASKTAGWDPNIIPAGNGEPAVNIGEFNVDPGNCNFGDMAGRIGEALPSPTNGKEDGYDVNVGSPRTTFNSPDAGRENANRRTVNANPTPGR